ncbi:MAG TPA: polyprenol monophosphomannose synthase [Nocardioidaceae bacterium]|nr:polyprenol monophosphomannose synthase [Nocardioidaceae bacterium]
MTADPIDGPGVVVIPTYNEAANIELIVDRVRASVPAFDVLIVDDGSPDGTGDIADGLSSADDQVHVMHRTAKAGLGAAYLAGFAWALDRGYDYVVEMDADGSHLPEQLPRLLEAAADSDLVLGSRWVSGGKIVNWPRSRLILSRGGNFYTRVALGLSLKDATGGYRVFRRKTLENIDLSGVESQGYCFQVDLARRAVDAGFSVVEVPITFVERERGESKMSGPIVREAFLKVGVWGAQRRFDQLRKLAGRR